MHAIWEWFKTDVGGVSIVLTILTALWTALRALAKRQLELRLENLRIYHELIKRLVAPDEKNTMWLDCQVGLVFELRHFPAYFEVSLRILKGSLEAWKVGGKYPRLVNEAGATIAEIENKSCNALHIFKQWFRDLSTY
jgi:hypothetical protein